MGVVTIRPDGVHTVTNTSSPVVGNIGGAASFNAALADNNDATLARFPTGGPNNNLLLYLDFAAPSIPANARIVSVTPRIRHNVAVSDSLRYMFVVSTAGQLPGTVLTGPGGFVTQTGKVHTSAYGGAPWTQSELDSLRLYVGRHSASVTAFDVAEVYIDVTYNVEPTATPTVSSATQITTRPVINWTYSDPDGDAQERFRVKLFADTGGAIDPNSATPVHDSGEVYSGATSYAIPVDLANGTSYRAFVFVSDAGSGGRYGALTSASPSAAFAVSIKPPATPIVASVTADTTLARYVVELQDRQNMLGADGASFEGGVGGWNALANCAVTRFAYSHASLDGSYVLRMAPSGAGTMQALGPLVAALPGRPYSATAKFVQTTSPSRQLRVDLRFLAADTSEIGVTIGIPVTASGVMQAWCSATAPANTAYVVPVLTVLSVGGTSEVYYVDSVAVVPYASTSFAWTPGGLLSSQRFDVERSTDGGATWSAFRPFYDRADYAAGDVDAAGEINVNDVHQSITAFDYTAPRGVAVAYRARSRATTAAGSAIVSPWSSSVTATPNLDTTGWWLKSLTEPDNNIRLRVHSEGLTWQSVERQAVLEPLGRANPVVLSDVVGGERLDVQLAMLSDTERNALEALRQRRETMLLQSPYGDHRYVRFGAVRSSAHVSRVGGSRKWVSSVSFIEVDAP